MAPPQLALVAQSALAHNRTHVFARQGLVSLCEREKENVPGSFQASDVHQFLTCGDEKAPRLRHEQDNGIFWTLTQACQVAYPPQAEVNELPSQPTAFARALCRFADACAC